MKRERKFLIAALYITVLIISLFFNIRLFQENKRLEKFIPFILPGEKISYFDLVDHEANKINETQLKNSGLSVIFIFKEPCSPCNENFQLWKRIAQLSKTKEKVKFYGIILKDLNSMVNFYENSKVNFNLYVPEDIEKFRQKLRLRTNFAQTLLCKGNQVHLSAPGKLEGETFTKILRMINGREGS